MKKKAKTKEKPAPKKQALKAPKARKVPALKKSLFALLPVLPQVIIIAVCVGLYYAMIYFYLFFEWGIYIYYALKLVIAFELISSSFRSLLLPLAALCLGLSVLFTNCIYLNTLMNADTAWQLNTVALAGILITIFIQFRQRNIK